MFKFQLFKKGWGGNGVPHLIGGQVSDASTVDYAERVLIVETFVQEIWKTIDERVQTKEFLKKRTATWLEMVFNKNILISRQNLLKEKEKKKRVGGGEKSEPI